MYDFISELNINFYLPVLFEEDDLFKNIIISRTTFQKICDLIGRDREVEINRKPHISKMAACEKKRKLGILKVAQSNGE